MANNLIKTKDRIDRKFGGRAGIHSVGVRKERVAVYRTPTHGVDREQLLNDLREAAKPYDVELIEDSAPVMLPAR